MYQGDTVCFRIKSSTHHLHLSESAAWCKYQAQYYSTWSAVRDKYSVEKQIVCFLFLDILTFSLKDIYF